MEGHFGGYFDGGGAVVGVEDFVQRDVPGVEKIDKALGELDGGDVAQAQEGGVGDLRELVGDGGVEFGDVVAVDVAPDGRGAVDIAAAEGVDEEFIWGALDDDEVLGLDPGLHGGEGMPEKVVVPLGELVGVGHLVLAG